MTAKTSKMQAVLAESYAQDTINAATYAVAWDARFQTCRCINRAYEYALITPHPSIEHKIIDNDMSHIARAHAAYSQANIAVKAFGMNDQKPANVYPTIGF